MRRISKQDMLAAAVAALGLVALACDGGVRTGAPQKQGDDGRNIALVDGGGSGNQDTGLQPDTGTTQPDNGVPQPDQALPQSDTQQQQTGPQGPFGSSVGMTAANFSVPDCNDQSVTLHDFYNKGKAVIVMLNKGS